MDKPPHKILVLETIHEDGIREMSRFAEVLDLARQDFDGQKPHLATADAVIVKSVTQVNADFLDCAPKLKAVVRCGTGVENIDIEEAKRRKVSVFNLPTGNSRSTAEFTVMLILTQAKRLGEACQAIAKNDFRRHLLEGREIRNLTIGILGMGNVGRRVAGLLRAFGCRIAVFDPSLDEQDARNMGVEKIGSLEQFLPQLDMLSLHASVTESSRNLMNDDRLQLMKPGARLINCARAHLVDEDAVIRALDSDHLAGYATDLLNPEPPMSLGPDEHNYSHPMLTHPKVMVTPHLAASTIDAQYHLSLSLAYHLYDFLRRTDDRWDSQITVRPARQLDMEPVFKIQTEKDARKFFHNPAAPDWDEHQDWYSRRLAQPNPNLWIIEKEDRIAGMVRFDALETDAEKLRVSILISEFARGQGVATTALRCLMPRMAGYQFIAEIHPEDSRMQRMFTKAGFKAAKNDCYVTVPLAHAHYF